VSFGFARFRVDSNTSSSTTELLCAQRALEMSKGGEPIMTFTDLIHYFRARFGAEEGQTMAEYGVVLAVITALVVLAIGTLSGAISAALDTVTGYL
jgi:Flp pilus assembly pilin Flp